MLVAGTELVAHMRGNAGFNATRTEGNQTSYDINEENFRNAIDVTTNAAGQIVCRVTVTPPPAPSGFQPTSVTGCQPLNLFGARQEDIELGHHRADLRLAALDVILLWIERDNGAGIGS